MMDEPTRPSRSEDPDGLAEVSAEALRVVESTSIFGRDTEVLIRHEGELYRMRITRRGRLILQK